MVVDKILKNKYGMKLNKKKTKIMVCSKTNPTRLRINSAGKKRIGKQETHFDYEQNQLDNKERVLKKLYTERGTLWM